MRKNLPIENNEIYNMLIANGVAKKVARELEKVHNYCNFHGIEIVDSKSVPGGIDSGVLYVMDKETPEATVRQILEGRQEAAIAVLGYRDTATTPTSWTTIKRRHYTLFFKKDGLPAQVYKL